MTDSDELELGFIDQGKKERARIARRRTQIALAVSAGITLVWLVYVSTSGLWDRVLGHWAAAVTMVFGSFVAGSTPQGGGAVAFPIFTKGLGISTEVARSFSLFIQTVGMGAASASIIINRRKVEWRAVKWGLPAAAVSFLIVLYAFADRSDPFLKSLIPSSYVKVTFTLIVAAMAFITYLGSRVRIREVHPEIPEMNRRTYATLIVFAVIGGTAAALTGSGADVFLYLFVGVLLAVEVKVGVPTSVLVMTGVSVLGFVVLGLIDGQLSTTVVGDRVVSVGGTSVDLDAGTSDLFGLWIAAAPVVAWGAPVGSWVASRVKTRSLVVFVVVLAAIEVVTTIVFVEELRTEPALAIYAVVGGAIIAYALWWISQNRRRFFAQPGVPLDRTYSRRDLDVAPGYKDELDPEGRFKQRDEEED